VKITPAMGERIRAVYAAGVGNGQVRDLAGEMGMAIGAVSAYANRQGWTYARGPGAQTKKSLAARELASLHCEHYRECLGIAAKNNVSLECHTCDRMTFGRDAWQKEVSLANISRSGDGEQSVKVEVTSCPVGGGRKKIVEKQAKDERPTSNGLKDERRTSNVQHRTSNEENPGTISIEDLPGPKSKGELETRICSQADCEFGGDPQPIDNFRRNLRYPEKRFKKCNSCVSKRMQAGQRRRQERLREERKEGKKIRRLEDQGGKDERLSEPEATTSLRPTSNVEYRVSNEKTGPLQACIVIPELPPYGEYVTELPEVRVLEALLDGLPEVFAKIIEIARDQERTPEAQVRYLLKTDYRITGK
jgi:hypothetical protein